MEPSAWTKIVLLLRLIAWTLTRFDPLDVGCLCQYSIQSMPSINALKEIRLTNKVQSMN